MFVGALAADEARPTLVALSVAVGVVGTICLLRWTARISDAALDADSVYVIRRGDEVVIPRDHIESAWETQFTRPKFVVVEFRDVPPEYRRVVFVSRVPSWRAAVSDDPIVDELRRDLDTRPPSRRDRSHLGIRLPK